MAGRKRPAKPFSLNHRGNAYASRMASITSTDVLVTQYFGNGKGRKSKREERNAAYDAKVAAKRKGEINET